MAIDEGRLGGKAARIVATTPYDQLAISDVTLQEIGLLQQNQKISFVGSPAKVLGPLLEFVTVLPITLEIALAAPALPLPHGDLFDRIIRHRQSPPADSADKGCQHHRLRFGFCPLVGWSVRDRLPGDSRWGGPVDRACRVSGALPREIEGRRSAFDDMGGHSRVLKARRICGSASCGVITAP